MKKNKLKTYKKIKNTRRFALGKPITKSGYESALAVDTTPLAVNEGYRGYGQEGSSIRGGILPSVLGTAGTIGASLYGLAGNTTSAAQAAAANIANAGFSNAGKLTLSGANALGGDLTAGIAGESMSKLADGATKTLADKAATQLAENGGNVAKAGLSKLGTAMAIALMAKGTFDMGSTLAGYSDRLSDSEINSTRTTSTNMRNGVAYQEISGPDEAGINKYTDAQNKASTWGMVQSGADIGAGVGAIAGSSFGPLGTVVGGLAGTVLGGLTNWGLDAIFGLGSKRKRAIEEANRRSAIAAQYTNMQNESNAATQGLRNQYNETHRAALGKNPGERWSADDYTGIQTPSGPAYGAMQGLASPDEGEIDMSTGETNYNGSANPMIQDSKADVIPVGTADNDGQYFDNYIGIPGHKKDIDGIAFADKARPFFKANEMIKIASLNIDEELQKNENHKTRDEATKKYMEKRLKQKQQEYQLLYQQNSQYIQDLVMRQSELTTGRRYSCGKAPRFEIGKDQLYIKPVTNPLDSLSILPDVTIPDGPLKLDIRAPKIEKKDPWYTSLLGNSGNIPQLGLPAWAGLAAQIPNYLALRSYVNRQQPFAHSSYTTNANQKAALDILGRLGYDNTLNRKALLNTARQNRYNILNTGGLSQGQKAMLIQNGLNQLALGNAALDQEAYNKYATFGQAYAEGLGKYGELDANRRQSSTDKWIENFRQSVGAHDADKKSVLFTIPSKVISQTIKDANIMANAKAMHNLYDKQIAAQRPIISWD